MKRFMLQKLLNYISGADNMEKLERLAVDVSAAIQQTYSSFEEFEATYPEWVTFLKRLDFSPEQEGYTHPVFRGVFIFTRVLLDFEREDCVFRLQQLYGDLAPVKIEKPLLLGGILSWSSKASPETTIIALAWVRKTTVLPMSQLPESYKQFLHGRDVYTPAVLCFKDLPIPEKSRYHTDSFKIGGGALMLVSRFRDAVDIAELFHEHTRHVPGSRVAISPDFFGVLEERHRVTTRAQKCLIYLHWYLFTTLGLTHGPSGSDRREGIAKFFTETLGIKKLPPIAPSLKKERSGLFSYRPYQSYEKYLVSLHKYGFTAEWDPEKLLYLLMLTWIASRSADSFSFDAHGYAEQSCSFIAKECVINIKF